MIKRTIYFGNPAYLSLADNQLLIKQPALVKNETIPTLLKEEGIVKIPIEDIGVVILDHQQITITHYLISALLENNVALITCNQNHLPTGLMLNLDGNQLQSARYKIQIEASIPLKKQLWQQTVKAKITNQARLLAQLDLPHQRLIKWAEVVKSGDLEGHEAKAAAYYWHMLGQSKFGTETNPWHRLRDGAAPNHLLNYGYAIIRAVIARSLVASGLLPTLGIFHRNQYNAYCLADDIMEPYRPYVDLLVIRLAQQYNLDALLDTPLKKEFLLLPTIDVNLINETSPLIIATQKTAHSLVNCFKGIQKKLLYPLL